MLKTPAVDSLWLRLCLSRVADRQAQLEKGDTAAQELVNSLQVLEVMAGAMAAELKSLVRALPCMFIMFQAGMIDTGENSALTGSLSFPWAQNDRRDWRSRKIITGCIPQQPYAEDMIIIIIIIILKSQVCSVCQCNVYNKAFNAV